MNLNSKRNGRKVITIKKPVTSQLDLLLVLCFYTTMKNKLRS